LFSTIANSIGKDVNYDPLQHLSIVEIKRKMEIESKKSFVFQKVTEQKVETIVNNINIKKATGVDGIPANVVKNCTEAIIPNLT
jgi:DNA-binding transcriptional regulator WhiA